MIREPQCLAHRIQWQRGDHPARIHFERGQRGERNWDTDFQGRAFSRLTADSNIAFQSGGRLPHYVQPDSSARNLIHGAGRGHSPLHDDLDCFLQPEGGHVRGRHQAFANGDLTNCLHINAAPIVVAEECDTRTTLLHAQFDTSLSWFLGSQTFLRMLNAMSHGVSHDVEQGVTQSREHVSVQAIRAAKRLEHHFLVKGLGCIANGALQRREHSGCR